MKRNKIIYWIATGLLSLMLTASAIMYFVNSEEVVQIFITLGYNARIVIPLAILKLLAVATILSGFSKTLREWAYFGLLLDFVLALEGHLSANDGEFRGALVAIVLWSISYMYSKKVYQ